MRPRVLAGAACAIGAIAVAVACGGKEPTHTPQGGRISCHADADCVLSTGGCCNCCPSNPTAIPVEEHKRQELHCASVNCACPKNIECPAAASVLDFVARCVEGTCKAVPKG